MSILDTLPKSEKPGVLLDSEVVHALLPQKDPFAFVDEVNCLYEVDGKVYFGELTFTPTGCLGTYYTEQADLELGEILDVNWRG